MPGTSSMGGVQHVFKGKRMGGRTGGDQITVTNLKVVAVDAASGLIFIKGAVPGHRGSILEIYADGDLQVKKATDTATPEPVVTDAPAVQAAPEAFLS